MADGRRLLPLAVAAAAAGAAGCSGPLSTLEPAGPSAHSIALLWWAMLAGSLIIFAGVLALAVYALRDSRRGRGLRTGAFLAGAGVAFPIVTLFVLLVYGFRAGEAQRPPAEPALVVEARGHQWWWEFVYPDVDGAPVYTAGVLHVPAGRPFNVRVIGEDVIHSFWIPRLGGKLDALPGHVNLIALQADRPGVYRGQCAEFCGAQHAHMDFAVEAHPEGEFEARLARLAAAPVSTAPAGAPDFARHCGGCHSVDPRERGQAPHLATLAERPWLGGGVIPHGGPEDLRRWLRGHQQIRPGSREPDHGHLDDPTLDRIVDFLAGLR
ncbi:MAG TPA: cytochrome c oxidase subunit II [Geminicoccaceae bacterium]|nr:cytochrome c oxidase subunit II [Geminicoccaceae bacterium]